MKFMLPGVTAAALIWTGTAMAGDVASVRTPASGAAPTAVFLYAQKMKLPAPTQAGIARASLTRALQAGAPPLRRASTPHLLPGNAGGAAQAPLQIVPDTDAGRKLDGVAPKAVGQSGFPFSTSRIELMTGQVSAQYPNRAVGRLGFRYMTGNAMCSASLIGPGLLLTAAHCVAEFGSGRFLPDARWAFIPGYHKGKGAYGTYTTQAAFAPQSYIDGSVSCKSEVICPNDVAVLVLRPNRNRYPGARTGWLGVGLDGYGFSDFIPTAVAPIAQLGYPGGLDNGAQMIRNDSFGFAFSLTESDEDPVPVPNTLMGSPLDGGSSGGPWVVNFGIQPNFGTLPKPMIDAPNMVVGVTSWGEASGEAAIVGSSPFTSDVLGELIAQACSQYPAACAR